MNVPIAILVDSLKYKRVNQIKLLLYLKCTTSGHFKLNPKNIDEVTRALNWKTTKTFHKHLQWLLENHWITFNSKTQSYRLRSYNQLYKKLDSKSRSGVFMDISHFQDYRAFIYAAVITWGMTAKRRTDKKSERKQGRSRKSLPKYQYYTFPLRYAAKMLDLHYSTISRYKTLAEQQGYLKIIKQFERVEIAVCHLDNMRKYLEEEAYRFTVKGNRLYLQKADIIQSVIHLKYKKRIRPPNT